MIQRDVCKEIKTYWAHKTKVNSRTRLRLTWRQDANAFAANGR
jgi:hypothetical protein